MSEKSEKKASKKKAKGGEAQGVDKHVRLSTHPAAVASVKRTRARSGLIGFGVVFALCLMSGLPAFDATFRALIAGIVCHLAGWYIAIFVWRHVIRLQAAQAAEAYNERMRVSRQSAAERAAAEMAVAEAHRADAEASWAANVSS